MGEGGQEFVLPSIGLLQLPLTLTKRVFGLRTLDEIGGLARQDVEQSEIPFRWMMRLGPMRADHADGLASARDEGCRLERPNAAIE